MCCLFGLIDYKHHLSGRQKGRILCSLSAACEARGTDATGIAYHSAGRLHIYKKPVPAHKLRFYIPNGARVIMGHTRMTTQGSQQFNCNNHPFQGKANRLPFALAHNGVLYNDKILRRTLKLPQTRIETDSYIAVQLIEQQGVLTPASLKAMAEQVEGSFVFTVLDHRDNLYFVKGDNPLCLYHFKSLGTYIYASTEEILNQGLQKTWLTQERPIKVNVDTGDILRIGSDGKIDTTYFTMNINPYGYWERYWLYTPEMHDSGIDNEYVSELKSVAAIFGYTPDDIEALLDQGFTTDEIEEVLYCSGI